jgi:NAD(P)-dependent dehydrogenase (short-subunit alcohol dehydrogenase family)
MRDGRKIDKRRRGDSRQVVVITGASSGIGRETARRFARRGARLVLASRSASALETVAAECRELGADARVVPTDVTDEAAVKELAAHAVAAFGRIDVWVGNASVFAYGRFEDLPSDVFRQVLETNLMGQVHGVRAALPHLRRQRKGTLVLVASLYSRMGSPAISPYVTGKFAVLGFAECLRQELRGSGIRVRVVLPATTDTPVFRHAANYTGRKVRPLPPAVSPTRVARAIERAPRRRRHNAFVGRVQTASLLVHDFAPRVFDAASSWQMRHIQLHGSLPEDSAGTVFSPPSAASPSTGGWRSGPLRAALAGTGIVAAAALLTRRGRR